MSALENCVTELDVIDFLAPRTDRQRAKKYRATKKLRFTFTCADCSTSFVNYKYTTVLALNEVNESRCKACRKESNKAIAPVVGESTPSSPSSLLWKVPAFDPAQWVVVPLTCTKPTTLPAWQVARDMRDHERLKCVYEFKNYNPTKGDFTGKTDKRTNKRSLPKDEYVMRRGSPLKLVNTFWPVAEKHTNYREVIAGGTEPTIVAGDYKHRLEEGWSTEAEWWMRGFSSNNPKPKKKPTRWNPHLINVGPHTKWIDNSPEFPKVVQGQL